jgi:DNA polymerase-3 subunit gamma/tau
MDDSAARVLARLADGGMRDGLSLLDQVASATTGELTADRVYACLGIAGEQRCAEMMGYIADHNTTKALELFNRLYTEGKDLSAMLDEMASMTRDLLVMKTAPGTGITMLSGVAEDHEVSALTDRFSGGELVRMMSEIQKTMAGFTRSSSRRLDAELCIMNLCQPELSLDAESLNARLTRLEEQIKSGSIVVSQIQNKKIVPEDLDDERPPVPDDADAPPDPNEPAPIINEAPVGFWMEVAAAVQREVPRPVMGLFSPSEMAPVQGVLQGDELTLLCANQFVMEAVNKPQILAVVTTKASAKLGRSIRVRVADRNAKPQNTVQMEQLLSFGRAHNDIVKIKE